MFSKMNLRTSFHKGITLFLTLFLLAVFLPFADSEVSVYAQQQHLRYRDSKDAPVDALLVIDVTRDRKPISKYLYGVNIANWCPWYYLNLCAPKLKDAKISVVRLGATNMERYNYKNNRIFNVIARENQYIPMSWQSFVRWCRQNVKAEPLLQVSGYGHVAGNGKTINDPDYDHVQTADEVEHWIARAGERVNFWEIGNEPWIAWKRSDYPEPYHDAAHGDQVLNKDTSYDNYFERFLFLAHRIKKTNPKAKVFGPTSANWWLYWSNDYSLICPVTEANGDAKVDDQRWKTMSVVENQWDQNIFPDRGNDPEITGWETDQNRVLSQYLIRAKEYEERHGMRVVDFMDVHRYIRAPADRDAIQEPRGLWQDGFQSWDMETGSYGIETKLLKRFQNMVNTYYPDTQLSFSEYDYFYWDGHPSLPQIAAVGQMDFLGFFAKMGVKMACNWYVGEPNQSGNNGKKGVDSAGQAMFNERGEPNPKYWAFWLMSRYFRGEVVSAESDNWDTFSVHACQSKDIVVFVANKGDYATDSGSFIPDQPPKIAQIQIRGLSDQERQKLQIKKVLRFGINDPQVIQMEPYGIDLRNGTFSYEFQPLAIYAFILSKESSPEEPGKYLQINPKRIDFGPYETGILEEDGGKKYTVPIHITNGRQGTTAWFVSKEADWIDIVGNIQGEAKVTDRVYLTVDRTNLPYGKHRSQVAVATSEGTVVVPVTVEVLPGESDGVKRICDFETGSLAHSWNETEPYSVGWWDGHGTPDDRNSPYIYRFFLDTREKPDTGGRLSMRVEFCRAHGDTKNGKTSMSFGTYGHKTVISGENGQGSVTYDATANWSNYSSLQFDIKTDTKNRLVTRLLMVITDELGNKGKPAVGNKPWNARKGQNLLKITDGKWQTIRIPLDGIFYDWRYPEGQNGAKTQLDFSRISQIEFVPWPGKVNMTGTIYFDNFCVIKTGSSGSQKQKAHLLP